MAVAIDMDFKGATVEQYDKVLELMGLTHGGPAAPHALFHWVTKTDDGIRVVDVWDSKEAFDTYAAEAIGPYTQQAGFPGPPELAYHDVYNYLTAG
jgi:hypothetical protein